MGDKTDIDKSIHALRFEKDTMFFIIHELLSILKTFVRDIKQRKIICFSSRFVKETLLERKINAPSSSTCLALIS